MSIPKAPIISDSEMYTDKNKTTGGFLDLSNVRLTQRDAAHAYYMAEFVKWLREHMSMSDGLKLIENWDTFLGLGDKEKITITMTIDEYKELSLLSEVKP